MNISGCAAAINRWIAGEYAGDDERMILAVPDFVPLINSLIPVKEYTDQAEIHPILEDFAKNWEAEAALPIVALRDKNEFFSFGFFTVDGEDGPEEMGFSDGMFVFISIVLSGKLHEVISEEDLKYFSRHFELTEATLDAFLENVGESERRS